MSATHPCIREAEDGFTVPRVQTADRARHTSDCGYVHVTIGGKDYLEHRLVWESECGPIPPGMVIHHINGLTGDNRIENLALMTASAHSGIKGKTPTRRFLDDDRAETAGLLRAIYADRKAG